MSAFLGHIHFWLYKKIRLIIDREHLIAEKSRDVLDDLADELHESALAVYGAPLPSEISLDALIDHSDIHGWLARQIEIAAVREASFIKDLIDCGGPDAEEAILSAFHEQGATCGNAARDELPEADAESIYSVMQNYYLNGMPCDGGDRVEQATSIVYRWSGDHVNQSAHWKKAGVSPKFMKKAYQAWFTGFVGNLSPEFAFTAAESDSGTHYAIVKK